MVFTFRSCNNFDLAVDAPVSICRFCRGVLCIALESIYPHVKAIVRENNFGMAVLSKTNLEVENIFVERENFIPALFLKTRSAIGDINLVLMHAFPPIGGYGKILRDQYLSSMSNEVRGLVGPALICGDFNTTPWTSIFKKVILNSGFDYAQNHAVPNTWPTAFFFPGLPIDHCLSKGAQVVSYKKGPYIGSDHWPLVVRLTSSGKNIANN